ncbi:MAG: L-lactate dehydrogenase [Phycisphaeraceae bacterium]|nr:MAG: L-lactate dehydrogenase [Phycisphaeraceae bacterium]
MSTVAIVGVGSVGSSIAYAMMIQGMASRYILVDLDERKRHAQALDLRQGGMFIPDCDVLEGDMEACRGADIVIVTAGAKQDPGQTRMDLASDNCRMMRALAPDIFRVAPQCVLLIVTNPVDVVTMAACEVARAEGFPLQRVIGSGTVLDTSRLRTLLANRLDVAVASAHALIVGEHGDSALPLWSTAVVEGCPLLRYRPRDGAPVDEAERDAMFESVRRSAYEIIEGKGATNYAIGLATARICRAILRDVNAVLTVSSWHDRFADAVEEPASYSVPTVVGRTGVVHVAEETPLSDFERRGLAHSAGVIREQHRAI